MITPCHVLIVSFFLFSMGGPHRCSLTALVPPYHIIVHRTHSGAVRIDSLDDDIRRRAADYWWVACAMVSHILKKCLVSTGMITLGVWSTYSIQRSSTCPGVICHKFKRAQVRQSICKTSSVGRRLDIICISPPRTAIASHNSRFTKLRCQKGTSLLALLVLLRIFLVLSIN